MAGVEIFSLEGRTALVAGASRGIGLAVARALCEAGARTVLAARSTEALEERVAELRDAGGRAEWVRLDTTDHDSVGSVAQEVPVPDILVNVVGTNLRKPFIDYSREEYAALLDTNVHGLVDLTQQVGRRMIDAGRGGKVIFIGSLAVPIGMPFVSIYALTKGALASLTKALAAEWATHDIQVNCILPGMILTELNARMWGAQEMQDWLAAAQANPRLGTPEDVAPLAVFLAGRASDYITGQLIPVDGGFTTTRMWPFRGDA